MAVAEIPRLSGRQFARRFAVRAPSVAWLMGAGTSAASGIPTGYDMIVDFKTRLFCEGVGLSRREVDPVDPLWSTRIDAYLESRGFPPAGDPTEYAVSFEAAYPAEADRRAYIEAAVRRGSATFGHRVVGALIATRRAPAVFTTNFDDLVEDSAVVADAVLPVEARARMTVAALDSAERAERCMNESTWPLLVKLHGDYRSASLKNTTAELVAQDERLRRVLLASCSRFGLVVIGYSGRDASVMAVLTAALHEPNPYPGGLWWVARPNSTLLPAVRDLLTAATQRNLEVAVVEVGTFDELAADIDAESEWPESLEHHIRMAKPKPRLVPVQFASNTGERFPTLRCSALPLLRLPAVARRVVLGQPISTSEMRAAMAAVRPRPVASTVGSSVVAFGRDADLLAAFAPFGSRLDGEAALDPLRDSWALGLVYDALVRALARGTPLIPSLRSRGHLLFVRQPDRSRDDERALRDREQLKVLGNAYDAPLTGRVPGIGLPFAEAVAIRLEHRLEQWWCVFDPFTWVDFGHGEVSKDVKDAAADWRRERWAQRRNKVWAKIVDAWPRLLVPDRTATLPVFALDGAGIDASFELSAVTAWSTPALAGAGR